MNTLDAERQRKEAALRAEAAAMEDDPDPRIAYLATWLVFYVDQHAETQRAWQASINRLASQTYDTL